MDDASTHADQPGDREAGTNRCSRVLFVLIGLVVVFDDRPLHAVAHPETAGVVEVAHMRPMNPVSSRPCRVASVVMPFAAGRSSDRSW